MTFMLCCKINTGITVVQDKILCFVREPQPSKLFLQKDKTLINKPLIRQKNNPERPKTRHIQGYFILFITREALSHWCYGRVALGWGSPNPIRIQYTISSIKIRTSESSAPDRFSGSGFLWKYPKASRKAEFQSYRFGWHFPAG